MTQQNQSIMEIDASDINADDIAELFEAYAGDWDSCERTTFGMSPPECLLAARIIRDGREYAPIAYDVAMYRGMLASVLHRVADELRDQMLDDETAAIALRSMTDFKRGLGFTGAVIADRTSI